MLSLCAFFYPLRMALPHPPCLSTFLSFFFHPSTFHIVLWSLKTLALESALGLLINAPKLPLLSSPFHPPPFPSHFLLWKVIAKLREHTHPLFEDVAVFVFLCPVTWVSSLPGFQLPCPKPPRYTHHCHLCFVIYYLPFISLEGWSILSEFSEETKPTGCIYRKRFIIRDWVTLGWQLGNPKICSQRTGDSGELMVYFRSESEVLKTRRIDGIISIRILLGFRSRKSWRFISKCEDQQKPMSQFEGGQEGQILSNSE